MKKIQFNLWVFLALSLTLSSCFTEEATNTKGIVIGTAVSEDITSDVTWKSGSQYTLTGRIAVKNNATLTIEPGVIVYAQSGTGANACALIITQSGMINAKGTKEKPIIFTSVADNIVPDNTVPIISDKVSGLWGGLIILGEAPISIDGDGTTTNIEGIPASVAEGKYGGTKTDDNSGTLQYVSVRYGGTNIGEGNEINGITFGGVGSGTTVDHIEVVSNQDDGIELFGGSVNINDVIVYNCGDDGIDTDQGYTGTINNGVVINPGDKAFELDGNESKTKALNDKKHTLQNISVKLGDAMGAIDTDSLTAVAMKNIYFYGVTSNTGSASDIHKDHNTFEQIKIISKYQDKNGKDVNIGMGDYFKKEIELIIAESNTDAKAADFSSFEGWSLASIRKAY